MTRETNFAGSSTAWSERLGGTIENAQAMAAYESPRTIRLHDHVADVIALDEVARIVS